MYLQSITCFLDTSISLALVISTCLSLIETSASSFSMPSNSNFDSDVISFIFWFSFLLSLITRSIFVLSCSSLSSSSLVEMYLQSNTFFFDTSVLLPLYILTLSLLLTLIWIGPIISDLFSILFNILTSFLILILSLLSILASIDFSSRIFSISSSFALSSVSSFLSSFSNSPQTSALVTIWGDTFNALFELIPSSLWSISNRSFFLSSSTLSSDEVVSHVQISTLDFDSTPFSFLLSPVPASLYIAVPVSDVSLILTFRLMHTESWKYSRGCRQSFLWLRWQCENGSGDSNILPCT